MAFLKNRLRPVILLKEEHKYFPTVFTDIVASYFLEQLPNGRF